MTYRVNTSMPGYGTNNKGKLTGSVRTIPKGSEVEVIHVLTATDALVRYQDTTRNRTMYTWVMACELYLDEGSPHVDIRESITMVG